MLILPVTINAGMAGSVPKVERIPRRIPFRDIREFAAAYGIVGQRFVEFRYLIEAMDGEALITRAEMQGQLAPADDTEQSDE